MTEVRIRATAALGLLALALGSCKKQEAAPPAAQQPAAPEQQASQPAPTAAPAAAPPPSIGSTQGQPAPEKQKEALAKDDNLASLPEAEKALDQAVTDLNKLVGGKAPTGDAARLSAGDARCPEACKAMSSLRRAAAAVCRLAGDATDRCARAKGIVKDSEARVAACKCDPDKL